jgi:pimeloyl-ACP methyl ester carboxylesterase
MRIPNTDYVTLQDGRRIGISVFGDASSKLALFYFHGFPGSRREVGFADEVARQRGLAIIGVDRPGFGLSPSYPGRTFADWPRDVAAVADALEIDRFAVFGISGGCPYALACAELLPERVLATAIISGLGPLDAPGALQAMHFFNRQMLTLASKAPFIASSIVRRLARSLHRHPGVMIRWLITVSPPADKAILRTPLVRNVLRESFREGLRGDPEAIAQELQLIGRPWNIDPRSIRSPVYLWHGRADDYVPLSMGEYLSRIIPGCRAVFPEGQGHFMVVSFMDEILETLTRAAATRHSGG